MSMDSCISALATAVGTAVKGKQNVLVSGTNIKTVNGTSLLGSGDLIIADHRQLTGTGYADSHPISAITGLANALDARALKAQYIKISGDVESALTEIGNGNLVTELSQARKDEINGKANQSTTYTKTEVDTMIGSINSALDTINGEII